jgi:hypothetical protein
VSAQVTISSKNRILFLHRQTIKMILFFGVPLYVTLLIFSPVLLKLWLGDRFVDTLPMAFRVMLVGTFMSLMGIPAYYTLLGLGHVRHIFGSHVVQSGECACNSGRFWTHASVHQFHGRVHIVCDGNVNGISYVPPYTCNAENCGFSLTSCRFLFL